jgi:hypothetical protein
MVKQIQEAKRNKHSILLCHIVQKLTWILLIGLVTQMRPDLPHVANYCIRDYRSKERVQLCQESYYVTDGDGVS